MRDLDDPEALRRGDDALGGARRVMLYGVTGSGKTTAAARISEATGIPWTQVDELTWEPGWVQTPLEEQRRRMTEVCDADTWVIDTAYGQWIDVPLARVELVVALDYPRWLSLQRLLRRTLARVVDKRPVCNGNTETWRGMVDDDSIIRWHFRSFRSKHDRVVAWENDPTAPRVLRFTRPRDLERWIASLARVAQPG
jgi:adenylate kinase family enzyme